jgi:hypothetical protein
LKGDFTRNTFNPDKNFTRVLMQQGRVLLDSDWNEQCGIIQDFLRKLAVDLMGPHAGPVDNNGVGPGFSIKPENADLTIGTGCYYVDGIRCENKEEKATYFNLNKLTDPNDTEYNKLPQNFPYLVYLDVWERHITFLEDDSLREAALGGTDTTTRLKVAWQVRVWPMLENDRDNLPKTPVELILTRENITKNLEYWRSFLGRKPNGMLKARATIDAKPKKIDPCATSSEAHYSGLENRLYRVEIHRGGYSWDGKNSKSDAATFKWSRENGSVAVPIKNIGEEKNGLTMVVLEYLRQGDDRNGLKVGDYVEAIDDDIALRSEVLQTLAQRLLQVKTIDWINRTVYLKGSLLHVPKQNLNPLLRRWDHIVGDPKKGGLELFEGAALIKEGDSWLNLEDGVQISFDPAGNADKNFYRVGDYWLIPARVATGNIQWPQSTNGPAAIPPHGVEHHYAPLMIIEGIESQNWIDCRFKID